jgi:phosphoserine aminotransferase
MQERVYNFSAGPAVLPVPALEEAQRNIMGIPGVGSSILEISHRSKTFTEIIEQAEANLRKLLAIPDNYSVLFLQGGAQLQFAMIPMNLLAGTGKAADYVLTGTWGKKAVKEARTQGEVRVAWDGDSTNLTRVPKQDELKLNPEAAYLYFCSNETIQGVQFPSEPQSGNVPLVCDASSDILSRPVPIEKYGILYACAQKNAGPAGVTVVIVRNDLLDRSPEGLPSMLRYNALAKAKSLLNTAPVFSIYVLKLVTDWLLGEIGGLDKMLEINQQKAKMLYDTIDQSDGFFQGHAERANRSLMNVTFRLANSELEGAFLEQAATRNLASLKGHRSVGGFRASIYNAMPVEGVETLRDFMLDFRRENG